MIWIGVLLNTALGHGITGTVHTEYSVICLGLEHKLLLFQHQLVFLLLKYPKFLVFRQHHHIPIVNRLVIFIVKDLNSVFLCQFGFRIEICGLIHTLRSSGLCLPFRIEVTAHNSVLLLYFLYCALGRYYSVMGRRLHVLESGLVVG